MVLLALLLLSAPPRPRADSIPPRAMTIYGAEDPFVGLKTRAEVLMGLYLVDPPRRHRSERVHFTPKKRRLRFDLWQPVARLTDAELKTRAVEWLVFGRTQYAQGARGIFSEMGGVNEIVLAFHEVIRPKQKGRRRAKKPDQIKRFLAIRLTRKRFERLKMAALEGCVSRGDCQAQFRSAFSSAKMNRRYTRAQREAE
jgi:hypothetical protein